MRKKSHINLASYLTYQHFPFLLLSHRYSFYTGSILPDCRPSFLTTPHDIDHTLPLVQKQMEHFLICRANSSDQKLNRREAIAIGQILHYIADYFTWPHNAAYPGSLADHCIYEKNLKFELRRYIQKVKTEGLIPEPEQESETWNTGFSGYQTIAEIRDRIIDSLQEIHEEYLQLTDHSVESDCFYIIKASRMVVYQLLFQMSPSCEVWAAAC